MTTIGAALVITDALSSGYLAYLAAAEAYLGFVDELVVVDGGSTDDSMDELLRWVGDDPRVRVVADQETHWGKGDRWLLPQFAVNHNRALRELTSDWGFVFGSDYVADERTTAGLREELDAHEGAVWVDAWRGKPRYGRVAHRIDRRNVVFNLQRVREDPLGIGFGVDPATSMPSDWPVRFEERATFADPETGFEKVICRGERIPSGGSLSVEFVVYGHFFYTLEQVDGKILRWEQATSRYSGAAPARLTELRLRHGVRTSGSALSAEEVLGWDHPAAAKRLIGERYVPGMQGGMLDGRTPGLARDVSLAALRVERRARGLLPSAGRTPRVMDSLRWAPVTRGRSAPS